MQILHDYAGENQNLPSDSYIFCVSCKPAYLQVSNLLSHVHDTLVSISGECLKSVGQQLSSEEQVLRKQYKLPLILRVYTTITLCHFNVAWITSHR